jgi:diaminopimelate epimerase
VRHAGETQREGSAEATSLLAVKGHGTGNDFIILPDLDASLTLSVDLVRALCDRHRGVGADGVLRVVRTSLASEPEVRQQSGVAEYFMDYRNADGSIAEMCGNGVRVFARYLQHMGAIHSGAGSISVATRGGPRAVRFDGELVTVDMGAAQLRPERPSVEVAGLIAARSGIAVEVPNPHVVVELADLAELNHLDLSRQPHVNPALPHGQNVEFIVRTGPTSLRMRVHERGVGETLSCGTGICAAVVAAAHTAAPGSTARDADERWAVDVPGGRCWVSWSTQGTILLTGPAVLVADVRLDDGWLASTR